MALRLKRGTSAERLSYTPMNGELVYDTTDKALYIGDGSTAGGKLLASGGTIIEDIVLNGNDITGTGNIDITGDIDVAGNIHATGTITADGDITIGNDNTDNVIFNADIDSNLVPNTDDSRDLGDISKRWRNVFANTVEATLVNANTVGFHDGDMSGSVFSDGSTMLIDGVAGRIVGPVYANVTGNVTGDVTGNLIGDVLGNVNGNLTGIVTGNFIGAVQTADGETLFDTRTPGEITIPANIEGNLSSGAVLGVDSTTLVDCFALYVNTEGTVDSVYPRVTGVSSLGEPNKTFTQAHIDYQVRLGGLPIRVEEISGRDRIAVAGGVKNRIPVIASLTSEIPTGSRSTFTVVSTDGIRSGAIFSLPGVTERVVDSALGGVVTTTEPFAVASGTTTGGQTVTFFNPPVEGVSFRHTVPPSSKGERGDVPGMIYATGNYVYHCVAPWNGIDDIWVRTAVILTAW